MWSIDELTLTSIKVQMMTEKGSGKAMQVQSMFHWCGEMSSRSTTATTHMLQPAPRLKAKLRQDLKEKQLMMKMCCKEREPLLSDQIRRDRGPRCGKRRRRMRRGPSTCSSSHVSTHIHHVPSDGRSVPSEHHVLQAAPRPRVRLRLSTEKKMCCIEKNPVISVQIDESQHFQYQ